MADTLATPPTVHGDKPLSNGTTPGRAPLGWQLLSGGVVGLLASFVLTVEKFALLANPDHVPSCSINPVLSCGSVMTSSQAELFGFPNPLLGIVGFTVVVVTGAALLGRAALPRWYWLGLQSGATLGVVFVHWLAFQSLYRIGALCPYCMVVWAVTIPLFLHITLHTLTAAAASARSDLQRVVAVVSQYRTLVLTAWFLAFVVAIAIRFWSSWLLLW